MKYTRRYSYAKFGTFFSATRYNLVPAPYYIHIGLQYNVRCATLLLYIQHARVAAPWLVGLRTRGRVPNMR